MRVKPRVELMVGCFVLLSIVALLFLGFKVSNLSHYTASSQTYFVTAEFDDIANLKERAPVRLAGVRIGRVARIDLNTETYRAKVTLAIQRHYHLPSDSSLRILTQGLLGANYIAFSPGYSDQFLKGGGQISQTHSALILENLIGQMLYRFGGKSQATQKTK